MAARKRQRHPGGPSAVSVRRSGFGFLIAAWILISVDAAIIGITNADSLIDDVYRIAPWTRGPCAIWSGTFLVAIMGLSGVAAALGFGSRFVRNEGSLMSRVTGGIGVALLLYWLINSIPPNCIS